MTPETQVCKTCCVEKPANKFGVIQATGNLLGTCKACRVRQAAERRSLALYGITLKQRDELLAAQGGVCMICGSGTPRHARGWATDHCHATGVVRGILCHPCNMALGVLERLHRQGTLRVALHYAGIGADPCAEEMVDIPFAMLAEVIKERDGLVKERDFLVAQLGS